MIDLFNQLVNCGSNCPADYRHQELKPAKVPSQPQGLSGADGFQGHPCGDCHCKGIHRQSQGDQQNRDGIDWIVPLSYLIRLKK